MKSMSITRKKPLPGYLLAGLIAIEMLMSFSFLGYFHVAPISITIAFIPVLLAGCLISPGASALVGFVFGAASMWKASAPYVSEGDRIFSPFLSGKPLSSLLLSIGIRVLFGLLIGFLYRMARNSRQYAVWWIFLVSFLGRAIHSALVYSCMGLLFPEMGFSFRNVFSELGSPSSLFTSLLAAAAVVVSWKIRHTAAFHLFEQRMQTVRHSSLTKRSFRLPVLCVMIITMVSVGSIALYFLQRMLHVLDISGYDLDETAYYNLFHLQIQFLLGLLSLVFLVGLLLTFVYRYTVYISYRARSDSLTDVLNRSGFFSLCEHILADYDFTPDAPGYFMILDIDYFKDVNDSQGHPKGDEVLAHVALHLKEIFAPYGAVGRIGGDEFAVLLYTPVKSEELEKLLTGFMQKVRQIPCPGHTISCSIGVAPITRKRSIRLLYQQADHCLYFAKDQGRDRYYIGEDQSEES